MTANTTGYGHEGKGTIGLFSGKDESMMDLLMIAVVVGFFWCLVKVVDFLARL